MRNHHMIVPKDRVAVRSRGCYSCIHYECGEISQKKYADSRAKTLAKAIEGGNIATGWIGDIDTETPEFRSEMTKLRLAGLSETDAIDAIIAQRAQNSATGRFQLWDRMIKTGAAGICLIDGQPGDEPSDFVHSKCLCHLWTGVQGSSLATDGQPLDKLSDELRDIADGKARKV